MEWFLDNLKLVIFVIVIAVYAFKAMRQQREGEDPSQPPRRTMPGEQDAAEAERTRQIQEEIRRRILARQRGEDPDSSPPPLIFEEAPPPLPVPPPLPTAVPVEVPDAYATEREADQAARDADILETQRALEEQLRHMRRAREVAMAGVPGLMPATAATTGTGRRAASVRRSLREDLAARGGLRRAIMLREILGEPVALRTGPAGMTRR